ncbi:phage tail tube protein [Bradyrhizobium sp. AUGA SZCCT0160]|uniref:phage tail tube protein n=1 Tax=Bradyrhizobium sp. AUGA SZCCT0160 TaxID=2807662 RepID=UPI001BA74B80|nr:phage tail tube protein [Bradyrhizobium sp. AUGA SZCCT0160]MBR1193238.1 phage tail protein [Bradyrhizobium sp. AUGA SZCCT0160]
MATSARIGYQTLFKTGNGASPEVFTTLAEVTGITPPAMARDTVDATHEESPGAWREFIAGLKDGGEVGLELNFIPGGSATTALMAEMDLDGPLASKNRQILFPDGSYFSFAGILTGFEPDAPLDDKMAASVTFKVTGKPTLVQA